MRILVVTSMYPPYYVGGYELGCRDAVEALRSYGHKVIVLTSNYPDGVCRAEGDVYRLMTIYFGYPTAGRVFIREIRNQTVFRRICRDKRPDLIFFWKLTDISMVLVPIAHELGIPICFYVFDKWIAEWKEDRWCQIQGRLQSLNPLSSLRNLWESKYFPPKRLVVENTIFASMFLKRETEAVTGPIRNAVVIPWGINMSQFGPPGPKPDELPLRLLYVGQIVPHKGVHVAIEGFFLALKKTGLDLRLTIVGDPCQSPTYIAELKQKIRDLNVESEVTFVGKVAHECISEFYAANDILIFPSLWDEPFGLTPLEAMSSGLVVVATGTGGSAETLINGYNALLYNALDPLACADQITRLIKEPELFAFIRNNSIQGVEKEYSLSNVTRKIERYLFQVVSN